MFCNAMNLFKKDLRVSHVLNYLTSAHSVEGVVSDWPIGFIEVKDLIHTREGVNIDTERARMFFGAAAKINNFHEAQTKVKIL